MCYVLKGWIKCVYEGEGEHTFHAADCVLQPAGIIRNQFDGSDDLAMLRIYSPAIRKTVAVGKIPAAADSTEVAHVPLRDPGARLSSRTTEEIGPGGVCGKGANA